MRRWSAYLPVVIVLTVSPALRAGNWHTGGSLQCGQCHAEHATVGGQEIPGGPYSTLLVKAGVNDLCLSCHDGSDPTAPDVMAPVSMYAQSPLTESAAGHFASTGVVNPAGHSLGVAVAVPLNSTGKTATLTCASCHDYHGNANYRNLRHDPAGKGDSISLQASVDIFWQFTPLDPPTGAGSAAAYNQGNIRYKSGWSRWCGSCHDLIASNSPASPPAHFNAHPTDASLSGSGSTPHINTVHWVAGTGEGFLGSSPVTGEGIPRVPFLQASATDFVSAGQVLSSNQVFCGSCHKSHGSNYTKELRWPYIEGGANYLSGCQQCHYK